MTTAGRRRSRRSKPLRAGSAVTARTEGSHVQSHCTAESSPGLAGGSAKRSPGKVDGSSSRTSRMLSVRAVPEEGAQAGEPYLRRSEEQTSELQSLMRSSYAV